MAEYVYPLGQSMRHDLEMKMANARNDDERQMYMRMMDAL